MSWPRKINGLQLQTSLLALTDAKGISAALTNRRSSSPTKENALQVAAGRALQNKTGQLNARPMT